MKRVLIVDDEPELAEVVREHLQDQYEVEIASAGTAALASVRHARPDVVFLDINMPGRSGIEVLSELRRADPTLPVIMVTVNNEVAVVQQCLQGRAFAYVPKPFDLKYMEHMAALATQAIRRNTERGSA
jgi:CheY-like chemotaxis protein